MLKKIVLTALAATVAALLPATVNAYGAAHVGYTHVGPSGVYHTGETVARGPGGAAATSHTTAVGTGGAAYHSGTAVGTAPGGAAGVHYSAGTTGGYHYVPSYSGTAVSGSAYRVVR